MPDLQHLLLFIAAGLLLNLTPGPDVLYIVSNALRGGARSGVVAGLGVTAGCFVHVFAAALGLSALLAASAAAFNVVKWAGAAYLLWIGMKLLLAKAPAGPQRPVGWAAREAAPQRLAQRWGRCASPACDAATTHATATHAAAADAATTHAAAAGAASSIGDSKWAVFRGGFLTNVLNPKVALFFLAFVPQFIAPAADHKTLAFLALGALFNINSIPVNTGWALAAAWMARRDAVQRGLQLLDRVAGAMFIAFGLKLALADPPSR